VVNNTLLFGIHRTLRPGVHTFKSITDFDDAVRLLNGKKGFVVPKDHKYFNPIQTATLIEMCSRDYSVASTGWGCVSYPRAFTTFDRGYSCFKNYHYYTRCSEVSRWTTVAAANLQDVYVEYKNLTYAGKTTSPYKRYRY